MKVLHVLAQLPLKTGSGVYFTNVIEGLKKYDDVEQAAIYGTTKDYDINILKDSYEVVFEGGDLDFPIVGMSDVMPYNNTLYKNMTEEMIEDWTNAFREKLIKAKEQFIPDVIITHHLWMLSSLVCDVFGDTKIIAICHNTDIRQAKQNPQIVANYVTNITKIDTILSLSHSQIDEIATVFNYPKEKIINIGAGYNEKVFYPQNDYKEKEQIEIVYAGKFDDSKGFYELITAFNKLCESTKDISLDLIGEVKDKEKLENFVLGNEKIKVYNVASQKELGDVIRTKDIFVLPSYFEGLGLIAVEALGSGLRVVATEIDGLMELLGKEINDSTIIDYVKMPRIYDTDKAVEEDKPVFVDRLVVSLEKMIVETKKDRKLPEQLVKEIEKHSWRAKIEEIYKLL